MPLRGKDEMKRRLSRKGDQLVRAVGIEGLGRLQRRTPVDKGTARANWNVSIGRPDRSTHEDRTIGDVPAVTAEGTRVIGQFQLGETLFLVNALPYIGELEKGSSRQAPKGMVSVTAAEMKRLVAQVAARIATGV